MKWDAQQYDSVKAPQIGAGRELISLAKVRETDSILDLGCGTGKLTLELARLAEQGNVIGIDPSAEMLGQAEKRGNSTGNISYRHIPAQAMKYKRAFDLVFSNSALQWIKDQAMVMSLVYQSLKDKGRIAFQLPARDFCVEFFDYAWDAIQTNGLGPVFEGWETPWYLPSKEEYSSLLKDRGFDNINVYRRDYELLFDSANDVVSWWASAGLRPFLERLDTTQQEYFKYSFTMNFEKNRTAKGIEFGFRRIFAFAEK